MLTKSNQQEIQLDQEFYMSQTTLKKHTLDITYEEYKSNGRSIQGYKIGKYLVEEKLGEGAYGKVYKGVNSQKNQLVAIKLIDLVAVQNEKSESVKKILKRLIKSQAEMMAKCDSPNLVKCYDIFQNKHLKLMLIEYCSGGTLQKQLLQNKYIPEEQAVEILKQILNGIAELHSKSIIHRDLKPQNILIHNGVYKIADFGFSKELPSNDTHLELKHTKLGTIYTMAPEVLKGSAYGLQADIWSIGIIFYTMIYGRAPYLKGTYDQMLKEIKSNKDIFDVSHKKKGFKISDEARSFISECLVVESQKRLTWTNIIKHKLFKKYGEESEQLTSTIRRTVSLNVKEMQKLDFNPKMMEIKEESEQELVSPMLSPKTSQNKIQTPRQIKAQEIRQTMMRVRESPADVAFKWSTSAHFQCLKTQLILNLMIQPLEKSEDLLQKRAILEILYLLSARCFLNMSFKRNEQTKNHIKSEQIVSDLLRAVDKLYKNVTDKFNKYSEKLQKKESQLFEIFKDKLSTLVDSEGIHKKDLFLTGNQAQGDKAEGLFSYTKIQQIQFTQHMINQELKMIQQQKSIPPKTISYLKNYKKICSLKAEQVGKEYFRNYVQSHIPTQ